MIAAVHVALVLEGVGVGLSGGCGVHLSILVYVVGTSSAS